MENLGEWLPFWPQLNEDQKRRLSAAAHERRFEKGALLHRGSEDCIGLLLVLSGQLRAYTLSDEGKELTLYRLLERDLCLFSASCILNSIQFDVMVSAEQDTRVLHIPADVYKALMEESVAVAGYTNELMASRFSDVMWLMDQILNKKLDSRLAAFLLEERELTGSGELAVTHEQISSYLGSVREVVTRMLRYFQSEGLVRLGRGKIQLLDESRLAQLAAASRR
jgi:CRP/FNR family transcriptional regulator